MSQLVWHKPVSGRSSVSKFQHLLEIADAAGNGELFAVGEDHSVFTFAHGLKYADSGEVYAGGTADALERFRAKFLFQGAQTLAAVRRMVPNKQAERKILYENAKALLKL